MSTDISNIAFTLRAQSADLTDSIKLSHAQQCVAAALGYKSLAAYQASRNENSDLNSAIHFVLDMEMLEKRCKDLELPHDQQAFTSLMLTAFRLKLPTATLHNSLEQLDETLREMVDQAVLSHRGVSDVLANTNNDDIDNIYLPFDIVWSDIPMQDNLLEISIEGHVSMTKYRGLVHPGYRINIRAKLLLGSGGLTYLKTAICKIEYARLEKISSTDQSAKVSLTQALMELLDLVWDDSEGLDDAKLHPVEDHDGIVYAYEFDFTSTASKTAAQKIKKSYGSLVVRVPSSFFDRVYGFKKVHDRHYVHGDEMEQEQAKFYCQECDAIVDSHHFEAEHFGKSKDRYFDSLRRWEKRCVSSKMNLRRPSNAVNILAEDAEAERQATEASRSEFHRWLEQQEKRNDPVGDLATDVKRDKSYPIAESSHEQLRSYFESVARCDGPIKAFDRAWREFTTLGV